MNKNGKIYVAGHGGLVGSAIVRSLYRNGYTNIIGRRSMELDLTRQENVESFFRCRTTRICISLRCKGWRHKC